MATPPDAWETGAPLDGAVRGRLELLDGLHDASLDADPALDDLFRAHFPAGRPSIDVRGGIVRIGRRRRLLSRRPVSARITLNGSIPWDIRSERDLTGVTAELQRLVLASIDVRGAIRQVTLRLPRPTGTVAIQLLRGAARLTVRRPFDVPVRVVVTRGANTLDLDGQHFGAVGGQVSWESPGFDDAADRYDLMIVGGATQLGVDAEGRPSPAVSERTVATVLFTDIVASTVRARELGDRRWRDVLDHHDRTARVLANRFGGRVVKSTGDGILAVFASPGQAVRCATAFRDELREAGVEIRAGLHTGEVVLRGTDVGGIAVHIGARVMGAAGPGQVLVSRTVRDLVAGSEIPLVPGPSEQLRGVGEDPWELFVVGAAGQPPS